MALASRIGILSGKSCSSTNFLNSLLAEPVLPEGLHNRDNQLVTYVSGLPSSQRAGHSSSSSASSSSSRSSAASSSDDDVALHIRKAGSGRLTGHAQLELVAQGVTGVRAHMEWLSSAKPGSVATCAECFITAPLRSSLASLSSAVFVDAAGQGLDVYSTVFAACSRFIVCLRHDEVESEATVKLLETLKARAPHFFDDEVTTSDNCPVLFVITGPEQDCTDEDPCCEGGLKDAQGRLRKVLMDVFGGQLSIAYLAVIVGLTGSNHPDEARCLAAEWEHIESWIARSFDTEVEDDETLSRRRRASHVKLAVEETLQQALDKDVWPFNAASLWGTRQDTALAVGACTVAVTIDVATAGASLAVAGSTASAAASATAAANSMRAWLFGFGSYSAAARAAQASANAAASGAVFMTTWSALDAASVVAYTSCSVECGPQRRCSLEAINAETLGVPNASASLRNLRFQATASSIKAKESYQDVVFYPEALVGTQAPVFGTFGFLLRHASSGRNLSISRSCASCAYSVRSNQLIWAVPSPEEPGAHELICFESSSRLAVLPGGVLGKEQIGIEATVGGDAVAASSSSRWRFLPGGRPGTVRLQAAHSTACLQRSGWDVPAAGAVREWLDLEKDLHPDQDWSIVPQLPLVLGDFSGSRPEGDAQVFWPSGVPAFSGRVRDGKLVDGLVFDPSGSCCGRFRFRGPSTTAENDSSDQESASLPELFGLQPKDMFDPAGRQTCMICERRHDPNAVGAVPNLPCGHGPICEACNWFMPANASCPVCGYNDGDDEYHEPLLKPRESWSWIETSVVGEAC